MFEKIIVHSRVSQRHPEINPEDVLVAWRNAWAVRQRNFDMPYHYMAAGYDHKGRLLEMVGAEQEDGTLIIYHAMKITQNAKDELGID